MASVITGELNSGERAWGVNVTRASVAEQGRPKIGIKEQVLQRKLHKIKSFLLQERRNKNRGRILDWELTSVSSLIEYPLLACPFLREKVNIPFFLLLWGKRRQNKITKLIKLQHWLWVANLPCVLTRWPWERVNVTSLIPRTLCSIWIVPERKHTERYSP